MPPQPTPQRTDTEGDHCLLSSDATSSTASDCPTCLYSFRFDLAPTGSQTCGSAFESTFSFGLDRVGSDYYISYGYDGYWRPLWLAELSGQRAVFYSYRYFDFPYNYNGNTYYVTEVTYGYLEPR